MYNKLYNYNLTAYSKIKKCIESCESFEQFESCTNMVNNFIHNSNISYWMMKDRLISIYFLERYKELKAYNILTHAIIDELKELVEEWMTQYNNAIEEATREEIPMPKYKDFKVKGFVPYKTNKKRRKNGKKKMDNSLSD